MMEDDDMFWLNWKQKISQIIKKKNLEQHKKQKLNKKRR
jgi:hypothetical protein